MCVCMYVCVYVYAGERLIHMCINIDSPHATYFMYLSTKPESNSGGPAGMQASRDEEDVKIFLSFVVSLYIYIYIYIYIIFYDFMAYLPLLVI